MIAAIFVNNVIEVSVRDPKNWGIGPSTARISCVHLVIILAVGVSSNHLVGINSCLSWVNSKTCTHRSELPRTESTRAMLITFDALIAP